jgi:hypothetical protein
MDTVILRNKRAAKMPLMSIKDMSGKPIVLQPHGYHGYQAIAPSFVQNHPDVLKLARAGWLEVVPGPGDGETLGEVKDVPPDSPLKSAGALHVPPGEGSVVPADPEVKEPVYLGDPSNPLPPDMNTGADLVDESQLTSNEGTSNDEQRRSRRKKDH